MGWPSRTRSASRAGGSRQALHFDLRSLRLMRGDACRLKVSARRAATACRWKTGEAPTRPPSAGNPATRKRRDVPQPRHRRRRRHFALGTDWYVRWFERQRPAAVGEAGPGVAWLVNTSADGRFVVRGPGRRHDPLVSHTGRQRGPGPVRHADGQRWVAWTPEGFFAASPDGEGLMGYVLNRGPRQGGGVRQRGQLREPFYRPDLLARRIDGDEAAIRAALARVGDVRRLLARACRRRSSCSPGHRPTVEGD